MVEKISILSAAGMLILFTLLQLVYQWSQGERVDALIYMTAALGSLIGSCGLITGIKCFISGQRKKSIIYLIIPLIFLYLFGRNWWTLLHNHKLPPFGFSVYSIKSILSSFWVFAMIKAASVSGKQIRRGGFFHILTGSTLYVLLSFYGILILDDMLQLASVHTFEGLFMEIFIFSAVAVIVFYGECVTDMKGTKGKLLGIGIGTVLYGCLALLLFYRDGRVREIIYSLGCHLLDPEGTIRDVGWLNYRMDALLINWNRNIGAIDEWVINPVTHYVKDNLMIFTWKWKPLTCIHVAYGKFAVGVILFLFISMMIAAANIPYHRKRTWRIARYIRLELWLIAVMGIARELFMIDSNAGLGTVFPFLGGGVELIPLVCILYRLPEIMDVKKVEETEKVQKDTGKTNWQIILLLLFLFLVPFTTVWNPNPQSLMRKNPVGMDCYHREELPADIKTFQRWEENGVSYYGKRMNGYLEGYGGEMKGDSFFFGEFEKGIRSGYGLYKEKDKLVFAGRFENGIMKEGVHFQESSGGRYYELMDKEGKKAGDGPDVINYMSRGELQGAYCGETRDGVASGYGLMISLRDDCIYLGNFQDGIRNGDGILFYDFGPDNEDGDIHIITGTWIRGVLAGHGIQSNNLADGFMEADWCPDKTAAPAALKDGGWFYKPSTYEPYVNGLWINYCSDGTWYYGFK